MSEHDSNGLEHKTRPSDFTGRWETHWPNGRTMFLGHFINGVAVGQHVYFYESGLVEYIAWFNRDGIARGTSLHFDPDGTKDTEETRSAPNRDPSIFTYRAYDENGDVYLMTRYSRCQIVDHWERPMDDMSDIDDLAAEAVEELLRRLEWDTDGNGDEQGQP